MYRDKQQDRKIPMSWDTTDEKMTTNSFLFLLNGRKPGLYIFLSFLSVMKSFHSVTSDTVTLVRNSIKRTTLELRQAINSCTDKPNCLNNLFKEKNEDKSWSYYSIWFNFDQLQCDSWSTCHVFPYRHLVFAENNSLSFFTTSSFTYNRRWMFVLYCPHGKLILLRSVKCKRNHN